MEDKVPDSISFASLRRIHQEKSNNVDFSAPMISKDIGDLAFLVDLFVGKKLDGQVMSHHQIFLADILVTHLQRGYAEQVKLAASEGADKRILEKLIKFTTFLSVAEGILDGLVRTCMDQIGSKSSKPSYRLVKSLDPSVKPHEIDEWIESVYRV